MQLNFCSDSTPQEAEVGGKQSLPRSLSGIEKNVEIVRLKMSGGEKMIELGSKDFARPTGQAAVHGDGQAF